MTTPNSRVFLGIDFGTSHTVAMVRRSDGRIEPLLFDSSPLLPSAIFALEDGTLTVGRDAIDGARVEPASFEPNPKRRIDDGVVLLGAHEIPVTELFAAVLKRIRQEATQVLGECPSVVALTYPAAWGPARRLSLQDAAEAAGMPEPVLIPEPVAAATYFVQHLEQDVPVGSAVVIHDFGGGTFDASVVRRTASGFEVLAVDGLDDLGGLDIDAAIMTFLKMEFNQPELWQRLQNPQTASDRHLRRVFIDDVRATKERLSRHSSADLHLPLFDVDIHLTRAELERLIEPMLSRAVRLVRAVTRASGLGADDIAGLFLVGGSSRIPLVSTLLHREFEMAPVVIDQIEQVVSHGALLSSINTVSEGDGSVSAGSVGSAQSQSPSGAAVASAAVPDGAFMPSPPITPSTSPVVSPVSAESAVESSPVVSDMTPPSVHTTVSPVGPEMTPPVDHTTSPVSHDSLTTAVSVGSNIPVPPVRNRKSGQTRLLAVSGVVVLLVIGLLVAMSLYTEKDDNNSNGSKISPVPTSEGSDDIVEEDKLAEPDTAYTAHNWGPDALEIVELDGRAFVASGAHTDPIRVWDAQNGEDITIFEEHDKTHDSISEITSSVKDGHPVLVSIAWGLEVLVWDPVDGKLICTLDVPGEISTVSYIETGELDGHSIVVGAASYGFEDDRKTDVYVWDIDQGVLIYDWTTSIDTGSITFSVIDGRPVVGLAGIDKNMKPLVSFNDIKTGEKVDSVSLGDNDVEIAWQVRSASTKTEHPVFVGAAPGNPIVTWDGVTGKKLPAFSEHDAPLVAFDLVQWGDRIVVVSADDDDVVLVWDAATREVLAEYSIAEQPAGLGNTSSVLDIASAVVDDHLVLAVSAFIDFRVFTWSIDSQQI